METAPPSATPPLDLNLARALQALVRADSARARRRSLERLRATARR